MKLSAFLLNGLTGAAYALAIPDSDTGDADKTTLTYTAYHTFTTSTSVTGNSYYYVTSTYTKPFTLPVNSYVYTSTSTTTYVSSQSVTTTVTPASVTTAPTPSGFIPLLSESVYTDDIDIETGSTTVTSTSTYDPSPTPYTVLSSVYPVTTTGTVTTDYVVYASSTTTSTITAEPPVATVYDACGPDNLATTIPTGQKINYWGQIGETGYNVTNTVDAVDCCNACQGDPFCFGGAWTSTSETAGQCWTFEYIPYYSDVTCDQSSGCATFGAQPGSEEYWTMFNGPGGQITWGFDGDIYFS